MYTAALFPTVRNWKERKCPPAAGWITTGQPVQITGNCLAMRTETQLTHPATWLGLANTMFSKDTEQQNP